MLFLLLDLHRPESLSSLEMPTSSVVLSLYART